VNRHAVVLEAADGYMEWARHNPDESDDIVLSVLKEAVSIFLVPQTVEEIDGWLEHSYMHMFEHMLYDWCRDKKLWPEDMSYKAFRSFFKVHFSSVIIDASDESLQNGYYE
jgi:hypothetical protein